MNRAAAWSVRGVGRETREAAQEAARRAGMSLGEWLDEVIADQAADQGVDPEDLDEDARLEAIGDRLSGFSRHGESRDARPDRSGGRDDFRPRPRQTPPDEARRAEELLDAAISRFESRAAKSDARTARALDSFASMIERGQSGQRDEREALRAVVGRLDSIEERLVRQQKEREGAARRPEPRASEAARDLEARLEELSRRPAASDKSRDAPQAPPAPTPARPRARLDLADAVSQIARRREELDARAGAASEPVRRGWRNFGVDAPARSVEEPARAALANPAQDVGASALQGEIRKLSERLEEMRREQSEKREAPGASIESLRAELAAMSRSLADLAPRNAVVALEGAIRDLSQRVAASRENSGGDNLLAPVEGLVTGLSEALRAHDPREAVEALRREIGAIAAKVDGIAGAPIDPLIFEPIRRQVEETRNLLSALAQRPVPLDRLEKQIGELADRVERLSSSPAPHAESAELVASLAAARAQVEGSTSAAALNSIERRLEQIAARMDQALRTAPAPMVSPGALEDLSRRIDGVRETLESRSVAAPVASPDVSLLEQAMREIGAKLDRPVTATVDAQAFESLFQDLGARIDRRPTPSVDTAPLEQILRSLGDRAIAPDTAPLEGLMREISAKLDRPPPPPIDAALFESMIHDLGERIDRRPDPVFDTRPLEQTLRSLHDKIDRNVSPQLTLDRIDQAVEHLSAEIAAKTAAFDGRALEHMVAELLAQLDETRHALREVAPPPANAAGAEEAFVRSLADLRAEQASSDRRIQSTLGGVHDMLETLVDRMGQIEEEVAQVQRAPQGAAGASANANANNNGAASGAAAAGLNAMDATLRDAPVFAPARAAPEPRADKSADSRAPQFAPATPMRSIDGSEFLIEPGSGAPLRASAGDAIASATPKSAINAHIAAARRAAQAALAETANNIGKDGAKSSPSGAQGAGGIEQAKAFIAARRRPILLGVALVALLTIAFVELGVIRQPSLQKSEDQTIAAPRLAAAEPEKNAEPAAPAKVEARALDMAPVGSIGATAPSGPTTKFLSPAPAELVASIPAVAPQGLRDAAAAGDPAAQFELASRLAEGRNVPKDPHGAFLWFDRAAAQSLAPAQYRLGALYEKGVGVARDAPLAMTWYKKAAEAGNARAMHNLAVMIAGGGGIKPDYAEAADWFKKAAQLGVKDSQFNLAVLYARGMGVMQDLNQSWIWFSLAAQQGDADAAKKRDEIAAKLDAKALAADATALASFHVASPNPAANDVPAPPAGWDVGKIGAPQAAVMPARAPRAAGSI